MEKQKMYKNVFDDNLNLIPTIFSDQGSLIICHKILPISESLIFLFLRNIKKKKNFFKCPWSLDLINVEASPVMDEQKYWCKHFGVVINNGIFPCILSRLFFQAYLVDYYVYSSRCFPGEPPSHIGFSYILPSTLQSSVGLLTVPITSTKHRPIGMLLVFFLNYR